MLRTIKAIMAEIDHCHNCPEYLAEKNEARTHGDEPSYLECLHEELEGAKKGEMPPWIAEQTLTAAMKVTESCDGNGEVQMFKISPVEVMILAQYVIAMANAGKLYEAVPK